MDYIGEHLLPGQLGHFFIVLSLIASLLATVAYFISAQSRDETNARYWKKLARYAFITESISVFAVFGILFYIVYNHLFEYTYFQSGDYLDCWRLGAECWTCDRRRNQSDFERRGRNAAGYDIGYRHRNDHGRRRPFGQWQRHHEGVGFHCSAYSSRCDR